MVRYGLILIFSLLGFAGYSQTRLRLVQLQQADSVGQTIIANGQLDAQWSNDIRLKDSTLLIYGKPILVDSTRLNLTKDSLLYYQNGVLIGFSLIDGDSTNELQSIDLFNIQNDSLYITLSDDGTFSVDLSPYLDNTDTSGFNTVFEIINDTLYIEDDSTRKFVSLIPYLDNTDTSGINISLSISNDTLYITDEGSTLGVSLLPYVNTDTSGYNIGFTLQDSVLYLTDGNSTISLPVQEFYNDNQQISINNDTITLERGGFVILPSGFVNTDTSGFNRTFQIIGDSLYITDDNSTLAVSLAGITIPNTDTSGYNISFDILNDTLYLTDGSSTLLVDLLPYKDNTDTSGYNTSFTLQDSILYITDESSTIQLDISEVYDNTDTSGYNIAFNLQDSILSITDANSTLSLNVAPLFDNTDTSGYNLALTYNNNQLSITDGNSTLSVDISGVNTDTSGTNRQFYINSDTLYIVDDNSSFLVNLKPYLDNTDVSGINTAFFLMGNSLYIQDESSSLAVDLSAFLDNTDNQQLTLSNDTLYISNGNSIYLGTYVNTDTSGFNRTFYINNDSLYIQDDNSVLGISLTPYLDNTDSQQLTKIGDTLFLDSSNYVLLLDDNPTNELQLLSLSNDTLYISDGNSIFLGSVLNTDTSGFNISITYINDTLYITDDLGTLGVYMPTVIDTDTQQLSKNLDTIFLERGGFITLNDDDPTNELQNLSLSNDTLYITNGNNVYLGQYIDTDIDSQQLTIVNDTIFLTNSNPVVLSDNDPTNELQDIYLSANKDTLYITDGSGVRLNIDSTRLNITGDSLIYYYNDSIIRIDPLKTLLDVISGCVAGLTESTDVYALFDMSGSVNTSNVQTIIGVLNNWFSAYQAANPDYTGNLYTIPVKDDFVGGSNPTEDYLNYLTKLRNNTTEVDYRFDSINAITSLPPWLDTTVNGAFVAPTDVLLLAFVNETNPYYHDVPTQILNYEPTAGYISHLNNFLSDYANMSYFKGVIYPIHQNSTMDDGFIQHALAALEGTTQTTEQLQEAFGDNYEPLKFDNLLTANPYDTLPALKNYGWSGILYKTSPASVSFTDSSFNAEINSILNELDIEYISVIQDYSNNILTLRSIGSATLDITVDSSGCIRVELPANPITSVNVDSVTIFGNGQLDNPLYVDTNVIATIRYVDSSITNQQGLTSILVDSVTIFGDGVNTPLTVDTTYFPTFSYIRDSLGEGVYQEIFMATGISKTFTVSEDLPDSTKYILVAHNGIVLDKEYFTISDNDVMLNYMPDYGDRIVVIMFTGKYISSGTGQAGESLWSLAFGGDIYYNSGDVGVGINDPQSKFQVNTDTFSTTLNNTNSLGVTTNSSSNIQRVQIGNRQLNQSYIQSSTTTLSGTTATDIVINPYGGNVGISNTNPTDKLTITGNVKADSIKAINQFSLSAGNGLNTASYNNSSNVIFSVDESVIPTKDWVAEQGYVMVEVGDISNVLAGYGLSKIGADSGVVTLLVDTTTIAYKSWVTNQGYLLSNDSITLQGDIQTIKNTTLFNVTVNTASNIRGGVAGDLLYQSGVGTTSKLNLPTISTEDTDKYILSNGSFAPYWRLLTNTTVGSALRLDTARTINGVSFDGTANITITSNTTNSLSPGSYILGNSFNGSSNQTWSINALSTNDANTIVARDASGNFSAGTITASLTGNASTATTLQTGRLINNTSFNGSQDITTANWGTARNITIGNTTRSVNGSTTYTWSLSDIGAAATNQQFYIGTTQIAINRASLSQSLTGVSIDGQAGSVANTLTRGNFLTGNNYNGSSATTWAVDTIVIAHKTWVNDGLSTKLDSVFTDMYLKGNGTQSNPLSIDDMYVASKAYVDSSLVAGGFGDITSVNATPQYGLIGGGTSLDILLRVDTNVIANQSWVGREYISTVTAGTGLTGGGTSGDVTLNVNTSVIAERSWVTSQIPVVNNAILTLATSGIATGSQTFTANQSSNATFTVNVPGTNLSEGTRTSTAVNINSSTGTSGTLNVATTTLAGVMSASDKSKLDGIAAGATANTGTVTNVSALTIGTSGTNINSTVANSTTTPVITLNIPNASATNRGALTTTDWTTFNNKQNALVSGTNIQSINGATLLQSGNRVLVETVNSSSTVTISGLVNTPIVSLAANYGDTQNPYASKSANLFLASPNATSGVPTFRSIVAQDIPTLNQNTTGQAGSVANAITFNDLGSGASSPTTYNGSIARTISYNTIGALSSLYPNVIDGTPLHLRTTNSTSAWNMIRFESGSNVNSDMGFILMQNHSPLIGSFPTENLRFTIGVANDFGSSGYKDQLWLQGGHKLVYNVGAWDSELNTIIGTPGVGNASDLFHEWRVNNSAVMTLASNGNLNITGSYLVNGVPISSGTTTTINNNGDGKFILGSNTANTLNATSLLTAGVNDLFWTASSSGGSFWMRNSFTGSNTLDGFRIRHFNNELYFENYEAGIIAIQTTVTDTTRSIILSSSGNVSIGSGNKSPSYRLDVNGDINISAGSKFRIGGVELATGTATTINNNALGRIIYGSDTPNTLNASDIFTFGTANMNITTTTSLGGIQVRNTTTGTNSLDGSRFWTNGNDLQIINYETGSITLLTDNDNTKRIILNSDGSVTISNLSTGTAHDLRVSANGTLIVLTSDTTLKENIIDNTIGIETVKNIQTIKYNWKNKEEQGYDTEIGFNAQNLEQVLPESVFRIKNNNKLGIKKLVIIAVLTKAIQEQQQQIEELKQEIIKLKND